MSLFSERPTWTASLKSAIAASDKQKAVDKAVRTNILNQRDYFNSAAVSDVVCQQQLFPASVDAAAPAPNGTPSIANSSSSDAVVPSHLSEARRCFAYKQLCAPPMTHYADNHYLQDLLQWCAKKGVFIHPAVEIRHERSDYRDFAFRLKFPVARHTPLIAVPEELVIGFKEDVSDFDRNALFDAQKETAFFKANHGSENTTGIPPMLSDSNTDTNAPQSDADICDFFFYCLGTIVADLVTAQSSKLTDGRYEFAKNLTRIRTLQNAPYLPDNIIFATKKAEGVVTEEKKTQEDPKKKEAVERKKSADDASDEEDSAEDTTAAPVKEEDCCLADILLQMIRNYLNGGPLVGKLDRPDLMSAVSMCLSHSTPLIIGPRRSIGIVPLVHLFPHGGKKTNAVVVGRPDDNGGLFRTLIKEKRARQGPPPALVVSGTAVSASAPAAAKPISAALEMAEYFTMLCGYDFVSSIIVPNAAANSTTATTPSTAPPPTSAAVKGTSSGQNTTAPFTKGFVYVVALRDMSTDEAVHVQAMAPVCGKEEESAHMWQLSCGLAPQEYLPTHVVADAARATLEEIIGGVGSD